MSATTLTSTPKLTTIHLVGSLGRAIGHHKLELDVYSVTEAVRAIDIITNGKMSRYLSGPGKDRLYRVALQRRDNTVAYEELRNRSGRSDIYIMPTIRGRNSGGGKILAGIALLVLAYFTGGLAAGASGWAGAGATASTGASFSALGSVVVGFGVSLVVGGITQLLTPQARTSTNAEAAQSTAFQGNASAVVQGGPMPVVYGRALVPAVPISITVENNDVGITDAGNLGAVGITRLDGGGTQYYTDEP
jgi:predicted phage tail protein